MSRECGADAALVTGVELLDRLDPPPPSGPRALVEDRVPDRLARRLEQPGGEEAVRARHARIVAQMPGEAEPEADRGRPRAGVARAGSSLNAREARWIRRDGRGYSLPLTGWTEEEAETLFPQLGVALVRLEPGEPIGMYHWEADQEDFLVLAGAATLIVDGEERPLRQWDFVHCPPGTAHMIVGSGDGAVPDPRRRSPRAHRRGLQRRRLRRRRGRALGHGASLERETSDPAMAYERFPPSEPVAIPRRLAAGLATSCGRARSRTRPAARGPARSGSRSPSRSGRSRGRRSGA